MDVLGEALVERNVIQCMEFGILRTFILGLCIADVRMRYLQIPGWESSGSAVGSKMQAGISPEEK